MAAKYDVKSSVQKLLDELKASNHVLVQFTNPELQSTSFKNTFDFEEFHKEATSQSSSDTIRDLRNLKSPSFLIFSPYEFSKNKVQIVRLLFIISEKDDFDNTDSTSHSKSSETLDKNEFTYQKIKNQYDDGVKMEELNNGGVRRLSSSNSFLDMNVTMNKLSKLAQINPNFNMNKKAKDDDQGGAFIITPNNKADGYLIYIKLPKLIEGVFQII